MYITSGQKTAAMIGSLMIIGAGAFVYLDPMELDLLGLNPAPVAKSPVVRPAVAKKAPSQPAKPAQKSPVAKSEEGAKTKNRAAMKEILKAPSAMKSEAPSRKAAMPKALILPTPEEIAAVMQLKESESESTSVMKQPASTKPRRTMNTPYPPSMDLRHCLDEKTPQEIAKCAGEL